MERIKYPRFRHRGHQQSRMQHHFGRPMEPPPTPKVVNYREIEKKILDRILDPGVYDNRQRPKGLNKTSKRQTANISSLFQFLLLQKPEPRSST